MDRALYDRLVSITDELQSMTDIDHPLVALAAHAARVARDRERPTIRVERADIRSGQPKDSIWHMYPRCPEDCKAKGSWGATGVMPPGHVMVLWNTGGYLAHLRSH